MTCDDNPACGEKYSRIPPVVVGIEPWPNSMAYAPLFPVMQRVSNEITTSLSTDPNPYLWTENLDASEGGIVDGQWNRTSPSTLQESSWISEDGEFFRSQPFWTASFPNGTTTGVLREHAMRLNSSIKCERIFPDDFPANCPGDDPFVSGYTYSGESQNQNLSLRVCAPGNFRQTPWTRSRDRQDIREQLYIYYSYAMDRDVVGYVPDKPFALHCVAITTRGYFELGNYFNGQAPQPLHTTWPTTKEMHENFVDYDFFSGENFSTLTDQCVANIDPIL